MKKIIALVIALVLCVCACSPLLMADAASVKTLTADTYQKISQKGQYFKIVVGKEGYLTITVKGSKDASASIYVLNSKKKAFTNDDYIYVNSVRMTQTLKVAVSKGTYYLSVSSYYSYGTGASVKYNFKAITDTKNYCISNARTLKAGTTDTIYQTQNRHYSRWYKISLTSSKAITVKTNNCTVYIYDVEGNNISGTRSYESDYNSYKTGKLAKGTYYLFVSDDGSNFKSKISTLSWK